MDSKVKQFIAKYQIFERDQVQQIQLQHRFALVDAFRIEPGMRILEIGCGQGDTTVALADAVGPTGKVFAIDIAAGEYGAPFTLSQAHERIQNSSLGERISFYLETDFLDFELVEPVDVVVLSHCSWYFKSKEQLRRYFEHIQQLNARVCFAEWDMAMTHISQRSHFCAVSILALYSAFIRNEGNIQLVLSKEQIQLLAEEAQFSLVHQEVVDASYLQDGMWEKAFANEIVNDFVNLPEAMQVLASSYYDVMNSAEEVKSLNSFVLIFERK